MSIYQYPLKIDEEIMQRLKEIAEEEGRSVNKQIEYIIKKFIEDYDTSQ